jgi:hypothetical protein
VERRRIDGGPALDRRTEAIAMELCTCPECGLPAEVVTDGVPGRTDVQLVGVRCIGRHWFFGLRERLVPESIAA